MPSSAFQSLQNIVWIFDLVIASYEDRSVACTPNSCDGLAQTNSRYRCACVCVAGSQKCHISAGLMIPHKNSGFRCRCSCARLEPKACRIPAGLMDPISEAVGMAKDTGRAAADMAGVERSPDEGERLQQVMEVENGMECVLHVMSSLAY